MERGPGRARSDWILSGASHPLRNGNETMFLTTLIDSLINAIIPLIVQLIISIFFGGLTATP